MKTYWFAAALLTLALSASASAQTMTGVFAAQGDRVSAGSARFTFPKSFGGLTLVETSEVSRKGESLDNVAVFRSVDGKTTASLYVYRAGYADAALAAYETSKVLPVVWGPAVAVSSATSVAFAGRPGSAIRVVYKGATRPETGDVASAGAFAHIGGWVVKLRVTGPVASQVEAAADAFLAAVELGKDAQLFAAQPLSFAAACPPAQSGTVKGVKGKDSMANALGASIMLTPQDNAPKDGKGLAPLFPANGATPVCSRGTLEGTTAEVFQPAGAAKPDGILIVVNDTGDVIAITKNLIGDNYTIVRTKIGMAAVLGEIDRVPDNAELVRLFKGDIAGALTPRITVVGKANGDSTINIDSSMMLMK